MKLTRRKFLATSGGSLIASGALPPVDLSTSADAEQTPVAVVPQTAIRLHVNGRPIEVAVEDRWTLAELLRDRLELTGTKIGCDRSECGACTVLLDGMPIYSCTYLAAWTDGRRVETVESLATDGTLHPLQQSFIAHDAPQCGFCTSGQLMTAKALLAQEPRPTAETVRSALTGVLCRCSNYNRYVEAVVDAHRFDRPTAAGRGKGND
jgi:xanthine dehydrogenase YagT iron-sulfur-binding subunit